MKHPRFGPQKISKFHPKPKTFSRIHPERRKIPQKPGGSGRIAQENSGKERRGVALSSDTPEEGQ